MLSDIAVQADAGNRVGFDVRGHAMSGGIRQLDTHGFRGGQPEADLGVSWQWTVMDYGRIGRIRLAHTAGQSTGPDQQGHGSYDHDTACQSSAHIRHQPRDESND
jgi:hypothetical protein